MSAPPRRARRILSLLLPRQERDTILSELQDLYALRVASRGTRAANRWYWRQCWAFPLRLAVAGRGGPTVSGTGPAATGWLDPARRDLAYALRRLRRAPGFSTVAVLSLALGIGANTAMFTIVNAVLFADPPYRDADRLVDVYTSDSGGTLYATWSYPDIEDLTRDGAALFEGVTASRTFIAASGDVSDPTVLMGEAVSPGAFSLLGIPPRLGRTFDAREAGPSGSSPVALLNHRTWVSAFGSDPDVVGKPIRINQRDYTVIGVMPEWYTGSFPAFHSEVWLPINMVHTVLGGAEDPNTRRGSRSMFVRARLRPDVSVEQANTWLAGFGRTLGETYPDTNRERVYTAVALDDILVHPLVDGALLPVAGLLMAMVALVLLIACANLASFLLARAEQRRREIAVRRSLGAGRASLIRQLLVETVLLALLGGAFGVLLARWAVDALVSFRPPIPMPLHLDLPLDGTVLAFTVGVSLVAGVLFGVLPAFQAARADVAGTLREEGTSITRRSKTRQAVVVAQVALSLVLLIASGLFLRSLVNAQDADPGFYTGSGAVLWPNLSLTGVPDEDGPAVWGRLVSSLEGTPGITGVGMTDILPLGFGVQTRNLIVPGVPGPGLQGDHEVDFAWASDDFFDVMEMPLLRGRSFGSEDGPDADPVAVVTRAFEDAFFPEGAVGRSVEDGDRQVRIVGVLADAKVRTLGEAPRPKIYLPLSQQYLDALQVVVRGDGSSEQVLARALDAVFDAEPRLVLFDRRTLEEHFAVHLFPPRMAALLLSLFGGLALVLAAIGIFGVVSHAVERRTREVGIRMSLGATRRAVVRLMVGSGMRVVGVGVVLGLVLAAGVGRLVANFLYGVRPFDAVAFVGIPLLLVTVAWAAAWLPARRAARVDPVRALRSD